MKKEFKDAVLSEDKKHRFVLSRIWDKQKPYVMFIGLNPSTADGNTDDATIRRLRGFSSRLGYGGFYIVNLFTYRATQPHELHAPGVVVNHELADSYITATAEKCQAVVFCWGNDGMLYNRDQDIIKLFPGALCFGKTQNGNPRHPVRLPYSQTLTPFSHA